MPVEFKSTFRKCWPALGRRVGVFVCLLALTVVVFGHWEGAAAASIEGSPAAISQGHNGGPSDHSDHEGMPAGHHCAHLGQCSVHAVLPPAVPANHPGTLQQRPAAARLLESWTISPLRHPPKLRSVL
jgi:hypothetical protein